MATSHPYISGAGNIAQMISQLRKSFPAKVTSDTVKKLGLAPNNESHVINSLQFIGLINEEGLKTEQGGIVFSKHKDDEFSAAFSTLVKNAYSELFELRGDAAWILEPDDLITFFRQNDQTSDAIGKRQAAVFKTFAAISGYADLQPPRVTKAKTTNKENKTARSTKPAATPQKPAHIINNTPPIASRDFGLSVRIEINLPANASKETYDNIFKSIKENLIDV